MPVLLDELTSLVTAFEDARIEYALCGGLAMAAHGYIRATLDIDFLIRPESLEEAYKVAGELGYDIHGLDISFKERVVEIRRVSKVIGQDVLSLDLLLVTPQVEDIWHGREKIGFIGRKLTVVSRQGLISLKKLAGRPQDLADLQKLESNEG